MDGYDFMAISAWELEESQRISDWQRWVKQVEKLLHIRSLDGNQEEDGYSLDFAHDAFERELSPKQYADSVVKR
jgi:hypothetical protein